MNLKEFAALKVGDKIDNLFAGSHGEVVEVTSTTVLVRWHKGTAPRTYGANTTAWMHWDKAEPAISPELDKALDAFVADKPADIAGPA